MSNITRRLLVAAAVGSSALAAAAPARAENQHVCVEIALQRSAKKPADPPAKPERAPEAAAPKPPAPPAPDAPQPPGAAAADAAPDPGHVKLAVLPTPAPPPAPAPPLRPVAPPRPEADTSSVVTPGSDADVLPHDAAAKLGTAEGLPLGQRPLSYMKRLLEYYVSHEKGFVAVQSGCEQTISVELYPLVDGWTAFARYSGTGREERVDRLLPTELSQFAERAVTSLLYGKPISTTINRENVLVSDSKEYAQRIHGSSHFIMAVGTQVRAGRFATAGADGKATDQLRVFSPVSAFMGYRGRFESWGLEVGAIGGMGTSLTSDTANPAGGHIDFAGDAGLQLHFLRYFDPRGLTSFYYGAGATFELLFFQAIAAADSRQNGPRSYLLGGGVDVDLLLGWEFMRASTAQFFLQAEAQAPAYVLSNENSDGQIHTYFPAVGLKLGVMF